jgi:hypothetical protein
MNRLSRFVALAAIVGLPVVAQAQGAQTASITTTADVQTVFSFGTPTAMSFPAIVPGAAAVTASGSIPFTRNTVVTYTINSISTLTQSDGTTKITGGTTAGNTGSLTITACGVGASSTLYTTPFSSCAAAGVITSLAAPTATTTEYINFTGSLVTTTSTKPGLYTGSISITATAN